MLGTKFITQARAASLLGVTTRTVRRYLSRGMLRAAHHGKRVGCFEEEVFQLQRNQATEIPIAVNRMTFAALVAKVQGLEDKVNMMARILNIKYEPLQLTDPEYQTLYTMAEVYAQDGWPPHAEEMWTETFVRLTIDDVENLARIVKDDHPWRPLLRLARSMHLHPYNEELRSVFASGMGNIQNLAAVYCAQRGDTPKAFDLLVERGSTPDWKLMRKLKKTRQDPKAQNPTDH